MYGRGWTGAHDGMTMGHTDREFERGRYRRGIGSAGSSTAGLVGPVGRPGAPRTKSEKRRNGVSEDSAPHT